MIKQILPGLNVEYENYCEDCPKKDFTVVNTIHSTSRDIQYINCTYRDICKNLVKILSPTDKKSV